MKPPSALAGAQPGRNAGLRRWFRKRKLEKYDQRLSPKMCRFGARSRPFTQRRHGWRDLTRGNVVASHPMGNPTAETALAGTLEGFEPVCVDFETGLLAIISKPTKSRQHQMTRAEIGGSVRMIP